MCKAGEMRGMSFEYPEAFSLLALPLLLPLLVKCKLLCRPAVLGGAWGSVLAFGAFACLTVAGARPVLKTQHKEYLSAGDDIVFVVDASSAMNIKDTGGVTRLDAIKAVLSHQASVEWGANLALVEMAQEARLLVPLTHDRGAFLDQLLAIKAGDMSGCAIGDALVCASRHLESSSSPKKSIVLISCGDNITGSIHAHTAARVAKAQGSSLYVVDVGKRGSSPTEHEGSASLSLNTGYIDSALSEIAFQGQGSYIEAQTAASLQDALASIKHSEDVPQRFRVRTNRKEIILPFLLAAFVCLLLSWITQGFSQPLAAGSARD